MAELRNVANTAEDAEMVKRPEMVGMHVHWLISKNNTDATKVLFDTAIFPVHVNHGLHRHPNSEEICYIVKGQGYHLSEGEPVLQQEGDAVYIPAGEWHGFHNHTDEPVLMVSCWGGVAAIADAGYEEKPGSRETLVLPGEPGPRAPATQP